MIQSSSQFLHREKTGLWVIDVQEKLFPLIARSDALFEKLAFAVKAARELHLPIFVTEQYPVGLGSTLSSLQKVLPEGQVIYPKTTFSGYKDSAIQKAIDNSQIETWILVGIEAHICVLQTAKDLIEANKKVVVLGDAIGARASFDLHSALEEMRACGVRVSSTETVLYEILHDAAAPEFKALLQHLKGSAPHLHII